MTYRIAARAAVAAAALVALTACGSSDSSDHSVHASSTTAGTPIVSSPTTSATTTAGAEHSDHSGHSASPSGSGTTDPARQGDIMFAQMMIPHHNQALVLAGMVTAGHHEQSAKVTDLAERIKKAQGPEIATMRSWLKSWGAPDQPADHQMAMPGMVSDADLQKITAAKGAEFDRLWMTHMIAHHEGAVSMAEQVKKTTKDAAVTKLANDIIAGQRAEIAEMKAALG